MIGDFLSAIFEFFSTLFSNLFSFFGELLGNFFEAIKTLLLTIFEPVLIVIGTIFYFIFKVGVVLLKVIDLLFNFVLLFLSVVKGLFKTLIGLSFSGGSANFPARYSDTFSKVQPAIEMLQINKLATLFLWAIWIFFAIALIKIVGTRR